MPGASAFPLRFPRLFGVTPEMRLGRFGVRESR